MDSAAINKIKTRVKKFVVTMRYTLYEMMIDFESKYLYIHDFLSTLKKYTLVISNILSLSI